MFATGQRIHFIGIGGIGMSGIAEILLNLGNVISGSDLRRTPVTERLAALGATIFQGHAAANVIAADVVVVSSAINGRNIEVIEARRRKIPVVQRAEMLSELMRVKYGVAVAGMHGKTTTTSMVAAVLAAGGLDPTVIVGGRVAAMGSNARLGNSQYLVAEADESDRSFLKLSPILSVVTNLDREHMDCYHDMESIDAAFVEFMDRVPFYGATVACADDAHLAGILPRVRTRVFRYGMNPRADFVLRMLPSADCTHSVFEVAHEGKILGPLELHVPGRHNVLNATAAVAVAVRLGIKEGQIAAGLASFRGVDRRFEIKGRARGVTVVDDYGHHPTEIRATLRAAKECGYQKIHVIFQPHRYTRTSDLMDEFAGAFADAATVEVLDIYAAGEEPIAGVTAGALVKAIGRDGVEYAASAAEAVARVVGRAVDGDVILTQGAGSVSAIAPLVLAALAGSSA